MEPLFGCAVHGRYKYLPERSAQVQDDIIDNLTELHAKMPIYGINFAAKVQNGGKLHVRMKVVGTYAADRTTFDRNDLDGAECARATHVATYVTVGAFRLFALSAAELGGDVNVGQAGVGATNISKHESVNEAGDEAACAKASGVDTEPPEGCSTSLQLVLAGLSSEDGPRTTVEQERSNIALLVAGAGVALAGASTIAYLVNDGRFRDLRDRCKSTAGCSSSAYDDRSSSVTAWDRVAGAGWVVGGAMLVGGGIWYLSSGSYTTPNQPRFGATIDPTGRLRISGRF